MPIKTQAGRGKYAESFSGWPHTVGPYETRNDRELEWTVDPKGRPKRRIRNSAHLEFAGNRIQRCAMKNSKISPVSSSPVSVSSTQLLTAAEVCGMLKISRKTLYNYSHWFKGRPPILHPVALRNAVRFRLEAIQDFIGQREIGAQAPMRAEEAA